jgi:hypothetical protein
MRNHFLAAILLPLTLTLSILFVSCKNEGGSGEAYTIKMRLAPGDHFKQEMDMTMDMGIDMMGQSIKNEMGMKMMMDFDVLGDTNNLKKVKMTYGESKMTMKMNMPGTEGMDMDSIMNESSKRIEGKSILIFLDNNNKIVSVEGYDELIAGSFDDEADEAVKQQFKKMFSKEQANSMLGMMFQMYPDKPVKVGESWEKEIETTMAEIKMTMKGKYTLKSVKDDVANILVAGKFSGKGSMNQNGMNLDMDMDGDQNGQMNIGLKDGYLLDSDYKMDLKANMNVMGQKVPMTIKAKYMMKGN